MRYVARFVWNGVSSVGAVDYAELMRWAFKRMMIALGVVLVLVGAVITPLPIPIGLPLVAIGVVVLLNSSDTAKRAFLRRYRRNPVTMRKLTAVMKRRRRKSPVEE